MTKILTVEDDQFTQDFIVELLGDNGYEVVKACNGDESFVQRKKHPNIQLILLDIMLPGRSGWDIFSELRRSYPQVKVIFVSAIEVSDERLAALKRDGLVDYIVKPFTEEILQKTVVEALNKK